MKSNNKKIKVYKWYFILTSVMAILSLALGIINLTFPLVGLTISLWLFFLPILYLVFSIIILIIFLIKKVEKLVLWIPSLVIFDFFFSGVIGTLGRVYASVNNIPIETIVSSPILFIFYEAIPVTILIISIKLLRGKIK